MVQLCNRDDPVLLPQFTLSSATSLGFSPPLSVFIFLPKHSFSECCLCCLLVHDIEILSLLSLFCWGSFWNTIMCLPSALHEEPSSGFSHWFSLTYVRKLLLGVWIAFAKSQVDIQWILFLVSKCSIFLSFYFLPSVFIPDILIEVSE